MPLRPQQYQDRQQEQSPLWSTPVDASATEADTSTGLMTQRLLMHRPVPSSDAVRRRSRGQAVPAHRRASRGLPEGPRLRPVHRGDGRHAEEALLRNLQLNRTSEENGQRSRPRLLHVNGCMPQHGRRDSRGYSFGPCIDPCRTMILVQAPLSFHVNATRLLSLIDLIASSKY